MELSQEQTYKFTCILKEKLNKYVNISWLEDLRLLKITDAEVVFGGISHKIYRYEIKTNHEKLISNILDEIFPEYSPFSKKLFVYKVEILKKQKSSIQNEFDFSQTNLLENTKKSVSKNFVKSNNLPLNYNYNQLLDSFIPGDRNLLAIRTSRVVVEMPGIAFNPFLIYGESGSGKTHLLEAIKNEIKKKYTKKNCVYVSTEDFLNDFINNLRTNKMKEFRDLYRKTDIFLLDDLESILPSNKCQNELLHTIKTLKKKKSQIVIVCEKPPAHINGLHPGLKRTLESGLSVDIGIPDNKTKIEILINKASNKGIPFNNELAKYIVNNIKGGIGRMEGVLMRLGAHAALLNEKLTINLVKEIIKDWSNESDSNQDTINSYGENIDNKINKILEKVLLVYQLNESELISYKREKRHIKARQATVFLLKKLTSLSLSEIGKIIGRNHSTVHAILKKLRKKMFVENFFQKQIQNILNELDENTCEKLQKYKKN